MPGSRRCWPSEARMAKRGQHRVSGAQDGRSERPATGMGSPEPNGEPAACPHRSRDCGFLATERKATGMGSPEP